MKISEARCRFLDRVRKTETCWVWIGTVSRAHGYGIVRLVPQGRQWLAHRLAWRLFKGKTLPKVVCHTCDVRVCVNPDHLFGGTHQANIADKVVKGRQAKGSAFPQARLTEEQVVDMRQRYHDGALLEDLVRDYPVDRSNASKIVRGLRWKHVDGPRTHTGPAGRCRRGTRHPNAKLTEEQVRELRALRSQGMLLTVLATRYGVSPSLISKIAHGEGWNTA